MPSHPSCIHEVEGFLQRVVTRLEIDPNLYPNILISLTEAINNAMQHGNRYDMTKKIIVCCKEQPHELLLTISDEGTGFDPQSLPDPTSESRIEREGGRGVYLMKELTDEIHFLDQGRTVELKWKI